MKGDGGITEVGMEGESDIEGLNGGIGGGGGRGGRREEEKRDHRRRIGGDRESRHEGRWLMGRLGEKERGGR